MRSFVASDHHPELFVEAYRNPDKIHDWDYLYENYDAAVDL